jgi:hypothetical protein
MRTAAEKWFGVGVAATQTLRVLMEDGADLATLKAAPWTL